MSFESTLREVRTFNWCHFSSGWGRRQLAGTGSWIIKKYIMWEGWRRGSSSVLTSVPVTLTCPNEAPAPHIIHPGPRYGRFAFCYKHSFVRTPELDGGQVAILSEANPHPKLREQLLKCCPHPALPEGPQVTQPSSWDAEFSQNSQNLHKEPTLGFFPSHHPFHPGAPTRNYFRSHSRALRSALPRTPRRWAEPRGG